MRRKPKSWKYIVVGAGEFPFDMLRYDCCWPANETDSYKLSSDHVEVREVHLQGIRTPHYGRWASFGWNIKDGTLRSFE